MTQPSTEPAHDADVLSQVERAIAALESHDDPQVRETVATLLAGIDAVHRAGLSHLVQAIHGLAGEAFLHKLVTDPAIRLLLMSYDLIAVDRRLQAEEVLDTVRGHLHDHGIDVEILEVVGGVVYVRIHESRRDDLPGLVSLDAACADLQAALVSGLIGFQELVVRDADRPAQTPVFVPLQTLRRANRPIYHDAMATEEVPAGTVRAVYVGDIAVLVANVDGEHYAIRNQCGESVLPLEYGTLTGSELRCSWHGCLYDVRSGRRLDGTPGSVQVFPVSVESGRVRIVVGVEPLGLPS